MESCPICRRSMAAYAFLISGAAHAEPVQRRSHLHEPKAVIYEAIENLRFVWEAEVCDCSSGFACDCREYRKARMPARNGIFKEFLGRKWPSLHRHGKNAHTMSIRLQTKANIIAHAADFVAFNTIISRLCRNNLILCRLCAIQVRN